MTQRSVHLEFGRKIVQPLQARQLSSDLSSDSGPIEDIMSGIRSRIHSLEERYSGTKSKGEDTVSQTSKRLYKVNSTPELEETDSSSQELFRRMTNLLSSTQSKVVNLYTEKTRKSENDVKGRVIEEFGQLSNGLWDLLFRLKLKSDVPTHLKEWTRKIMRLEDEKQMMEQQYKESLERISRQMNNKTQALQQELMKIQHSKSDLESKLQTLSISVLPPTPEETKQPRPKNPLRRLQRDKNESSLRSSIRDSSLDSSVSSSDLRHSRTSSGSFLGEQKITPVREERKRTDLARSISPAERTIHSLKTELEKCKSQLEKCTRDRDLLRAWKENVLRTPPDQSQFLYQLESGEQEKKKLTSKALILQHKLNAVLISIQKFIRVSSKLVKTARDKDLIGEFEDSRAEIEIIVRENQNEGKGIGTKSLVSSTRGSPTRVFSMESEQLDRENARLEKELVVERKRGDTFAEALELTNKQVENLSGKSINPVLYLQQQDQLIQGLRLELSQEQTLVSNLRKTQESTQIELRESTQSCKKSLQLHFDEFSKCFSTAITQITAKIDEKDQSLTRLKNAVLDRLQEQLKALIQLNELLSKSSSVEDDSAAERLREEKEGLEVLLTQSQEWAAGKVAELQDLLDRANLELADAQIQKAEMENDRTIIAELTLRCDSFSRMETRLHDLEHLTQSLESELQSKSAAFSQKETEFRELQYETQRYAELNKELQEVERIRNEDWILAQEQFQRELGDAVRKMEELEVEKQEMKQVLGKVENEGKSQVSNPESETKKEEFSYLQSQVALLEDTRTRQTAEIHKLEQAHTQLMEELDSERVKIANLHRELASKKTTERESKRKTDQLSADIEMWNKKNEADLLAIEDLKMRWERSAHEREEAIQSMISNMDREMSEQKRKYKELEDENVSLKSESSKLLQREKEAEKKLMETSKLQEDTVARLTLELDLQHEALQTSFDKQTLELQQSRNQHRDLQDRMNTLMADIRAMKSSKGASTLMDQLTKQLNEKTQEVNESKAHWARKDMELIQVTKEAEKLKEGNEELRKLEEEQRSLVNRLNAETKDLTLQVSLMTETISTQQQEITVLKERLETMQTAGREERELLEEDYAQLQTHFSESQEEARKLKDTLKAKQAEVGRSESVAVLKEELEREKEQIRADLGRRLQDYEDELLLKNNQLEAAETRLVSALNTAEGKIQVLELQFQQDKKTLESQLQESATHVEVLETDLKSLVSKSAQQLETLKSQLAEATQELDSRDKELELLSTQLSDLQAKFKAQKQNLTSQIRIQEGRKEELEGKIFELNLSLTAERKKTEELTEIHNADDLEKEKLESEIADLKENIRQLNSGDVQFSETFEQLRDSPILQLSDDRKPSSGEEMNLDDPLFPNQANPSDFQEEKSDGNPAEKTLNEIENLISPNQSLSEDVVTTIRKLLEELDLLKRNKGGVVIPRLQLRTALDSKESQTSARIEEEKSLERSFSASVSPEATDQDTPRQKILPEFVKNRLAHSIQQTKTEEIYSLHSRIKSLEKDLKEELAFREYSEMQIKLLKEELADKDRHLRRASNSEAPGMNPDPVKDILIKLISALPKQ